MPNYTNPIGKGKPPGALKKKYTANPFSAGASTVKKKKPSGRSPSPLKKKKRTPARKRTMLKY